MEQDETTKSTVGAQSAIRIEAEVITQHTCPWWPLQNLRCWTGNRIQTGPFRGSIVLDLVRMLLQKVENNMDSFWTSDCIICIIPFLSSYYHHSESFLPARRWSHLCDGLISSSSLRGPMLLNPSVHVLPKASRRKLAKLMNKNE